jgi:signal transduction histidine kinase
MPAKDTLDLKDALNGLGHAVLVFSSDGTLTQHNRAAATLVGGDLTMLQDEGWKAAQQLLKPHSTNGDTARTLDEVRRDANASSTPIRFQILLNGEYTPCWAAAVPVEGGAMHTMLTIDVSDWSALTDMIDFFRREVKEAVAATRGHIDIINSSMGVVKPDDPVKNLTRRIGGFNQLIDMQMFRTAELLSQMERMEAIRTGEVREYARQTRKKIDIAYLLEDFLEDIEHADLLDPETEQHDYRGRVSFKVDDKLATLASKPLLARILRDMIRNAIMYSMKATPIEIKAHQDGDFAQIDVIDQGYGVREKERDRVLAPFKRARQPQIIAEFGYGLSLYLCKHEIEAMNGRMWYESEEKVGSTFSIKLPLWRAPEAASSSSQSNT